MNCETARILMENDDPALAEHLRSCPSCVLRTHARYYEAPAGLEDRVRQSLRRESSPVSYWRWTAIAASVLLAASLAANIAMVRSHVVWSRVVRSGVDARQVIASDVLSAHIRSLSGTHLLDVPSSDQHTVKPWFNGRLDFSPPVKFVEGFSLLGGRLEYLDGHPAAALVYGRNKHIVNLFVWPSPAPSVPGNQTINGYNMQTWSTNGMTFWAVSDLNDAELHQFASLHQRTP